MTMDSGVDRRLWPPRDNTAITSSYHSSAGERVGRPRSDLLISSAPSLVPFLFFLFTTPTPGLSISIGTNKSPETEREVDMQWKRVDVKVLVPLEDIYMFLSVVNVCWGDFFQLTVCRLCVIPDFGLKGKCLLSQKEGSWRDDERYEMDRTVIHILFVERFRLMLVGGVTAFAPWWGELFNTKLTLALFCLVKNFV